MVKFIRKFKIYLLYGLAFSFVIPFLFGGISNADEDLLRQFTKPAGDAGNIIYGDVNGAEVTNVGNRVVHNSKNSMILRITRLLLILTVALAVTMILYNGMKYIIETGQGKEGKSLMKNVVLIVVGILIALFSVVIITLIQSIPTTLEKELNDSYEDIVKE